MAKKKRPPSDRTQGTPRSRSTDQISAAEEPRRNRLQRNQEQCGHERLSCSEAQARGAGAAGDSSSLPLESQAEALVMEAFATTDLRRRCALARQALKIFPDCIAAHILLGTAEADEEKRLMWFQQAIAAARRVNANPPFGQPLAEEVGALEVAPLMGALMEASNSLWALNRYDESVTQLHEILRLIPDDPLGTRYILLNRLLFINDNDAATKLLDQFADDRSVDWLYGRALLAFRQQGDIAAARKALRAARRMNRFVPEYLVGNSQLPPTAPASSSPNSRTEAEWYCGDAMRLWRDTAGAVPWVRDTLKMPLPEARKERADRRWWLRKKSKLLGLVQEPDEIWQVGLEPLRHSDEEQAENFAAWGFVVISSQRRQVIVGEFSETEPDANKVLDWLLNGMLHPNDSDPRRPHAVCVTDPTLASAWRQPLSEIEVECTQVPQLEDVHLYLDMLKHEANRQTRGNAAQLLDDSALACLPQVSEEWELDMRLLAAFVGDKGTPRRPWTVLVGDRTNEFVIAQDLSAEDPAPDWLVRVVRSAMGQPCAGPSRRPTSIRVATVAQHTQLADWLAALDVRCVISENLDFLDQLFADVTHHLAGEGSQPGVLTVPGVTPEIAAGVFDAAAEFYRAAPWRLVPADVPIQIESNSYQSGPWYAVIMGQSGMLQGLALYEDWQMLRRMLRGHVSEQTALRKSSSLAVYYGEAFDFPATDLNDLERLGWQIAGPEAYPTLLRLNPGMNIRRPLAWELQLLEASLRALVSYTASGATQPVTYDISTSAGPVHLALDWTR